MRYRIAQLSDLHLTASRRRKAWRWPVWANLERALDRVAQEGPFDRIILTGDLASVRKPETYSQLREALAPFWDRVRVLPGNHDSRSLMASTFSERLLDQGGWLSFVDVLPGLRLIGLDSLRPWRVSGKLGNAQRAWLAGELEESEEPVLLFLHHPVLRIGCWWLDKDLLRDSDELKEMLRGSCVQALFFGHVHQEFSGEFAGLPAHATPSTAYQFRPHAIRPGATERGEPAFRIIELDERGRLETHVLMEE